MQWGFLNLQVDGIPKFCNIYSIFMTGVYVKDYRWPYQWYDVTKKRIHAVSDYKKRSYKKQRWIFVKI